MIQTGALLAASMAGANALPRTVRPAAGVVARRTEEESSKSLFGAFGRIAMEGLARVVAPSEATKI